MKNVNCGKNVTIIEPCNLYDCHLADNVFIGPFVEIQKGVTIGENTRISSHSFICQGVSIGKNCFIGHGVMFTNDKFKEPIGIRPKEWEKTLIGDNVRIGSGSTLLPITIGDNTVVGAGSVVTRNVSANSIIYGNPAK